MHKNKILLAIFFLLFAGNTFSQGLPEIVLEQPAKYKVPIEGINLNPDTETFPGTLWQVFSDRDNNKTYASSAGGAVKSSVNFLEKHIYAVEEKGDWLHLIRDKEISFDGKLTASAEDIGWVRKDHLLVWTHCLVTQKGEINKKAMILNTVESIKGANKGVDSKMVKFCRDPKLSIASENESQLFQIFYIYKINKTQNTVLLGKNSRIKDPAYVADNIVGWVPKSRISTWDHRIALEPNWLPEAVQERKNKNKKAMVFNTEEGAKNYNASMAFWDSDPYEERNIGDWRRFPILANNQGIAYTGVMGEINSVKGKQITAEDNAQIQRSYNEVRASRRNLNFVFVINGSSGMEHYFKVISDAVKRANKELEDMGSKNILRYGVVVYRDKGAGERITEILKLTTEVDNLKYFLDNISTANDVDSDEPDAVFLGLKTALRQVGWSKTARDETNTLIHIGTVGNHNRDDDTQVREDQIVQLLDERNINFFSFQVRHTDHVSYDEFIEQSKSIMLKAAQKKYDRYKGTAESAQFNIKSPEFVKFGWDSYKLNNIALMGKISYSEIGVPLDSKKILDNISNIMIFLNQYTDYFLRMMDRILMDGQGVQSALLSSAGTSDGTPQYSYEAGSAESTSDFVDSYAPAIMQFLTQLQIPQEKLDIVMEEHYQLYFPGYAPLQPEGYQHPIFKSVLFLTRKELSRLIIMFDALVDAVTGGEQRQKMQDAWVELLKNHVGGKAEDFLDLTMEEINQQVFGLPGTSKMLKSIKLKHITDPAQVNDRLFQSYVTQIQRKQRNLNKIFNKDNYEFSFDSNDQKYYWISEDVLP